MLHISDAKYLDEYRLRVAFKDGREGVADLRAMIFDEPRSVLNRSRISQLFGSSSSSVGRYVGRAIWMSPPNTSTSSPFAMMRVCADSSKNGVMSKPRLQSDGVNV